MGNKFLIYSALLISALILNSCNDLIYSPEKENFVNVPVPQTIMSVNLANFADTIIVFGQTDFHYTIDTKGKVFSRLVIYVDSTMDGNSVNTSQYSFNSASYSNGNHKLRMEVWAYSGSGSLADHYRSEYLVCSTQWNLFIDNRTYTGQFLIDSCFYENGSLSVKWQKYPYYNFLSYSLYKFPVNSIGEAISYQLMSIITDRNVTGFKDSTYVGTGVKYKLVVKIYNNSYTSPEKYFYGDVSSISSITQLDENTVKIVCRKIKYYNNVSKFTLYRSYGSYSTFTVSDHTSPDDTVFYDTPGFGYNINYRLGFLGRTNLNSYSASLPMLMGNSFRTFIDFVYIPQLNSYYIYYNNLNVPQTDRLDPANFNILATSRGKIIVSSSGSFAYNNSFVPSNDPYPHSFTKVNPLTFQSESPTVYTDNYVGYYSTNNTFAVSETGLSLYVGCRYKDPTLYGYGADVLFDPALPGVVGKDSTSDSWDGALVQISKLTDEGEYVIPSGSGLYNIKGRTLRKIGKLNYGPVCLSLSGKEYIMSANSAISVYNCSNMSLIKSYPITNADILYSLCIDPATGYLGGYSKVDCKYKIYDLNNGNLVKEIQLAAYQYLLGNYYLYNSTLFANGSYMNLAFSKKRSLK